MTTFASAVKQSKFFQYWAKRSVSDSVPVKVYQSPSSIHYEYNWDQGVEAYLRRTHILREQFAAAGFVELDAWYFTAAMPNNDIHYFGCPRRMASQILFNIMCNQEYNFGYNSVSASEIAHDTAAHSAAQNRLKAQKGYGRPQKQSSIQKHFSKVRKRFSNLKSRSSND